VSVTTSTSGNGLNNTRPACSTGGYLRACGGAIGDVGKLALLLDLCGAELVQLELFGA